MESCSIGFHCFKTEDCPKTTYSRKRGLKKICELVDDERLLLVRRVSLESPVSELTVCHHHEQILLHRYSFQTCCNPFI